MVEKRIEERFKYLAIGITGSPATGKKTVAKTLSRMTGLRIILLNRLAIRTKSGRMIDGEFAVDLRKLRRNKIETKGSIIVGHLLPLVIPSSALDFVAILRCSPKILYRRYLARGYAEQKIRENIEAELLDLVSYSALRKYGRRKVSEFDTSRIKSPTVVARRILQTIEGKRPRKYGIAKWAERASRSDRNLLRIMRS